MKIDKEKAETFYNDVFLCGGIMDTDIFDGFKDNNEGCIAFLKEMADAFERFCIVGR